MVRTKGRASGPGELTVGSRMSCLVCGRQLEAPLSRMLQNELGGQDPASGPAEESEVGFRGSDERVGYSVM